MLNCRKNACIPLLLVLSFISNAGVPNIFAAETSKAQDALPPRGLAAALCAVVTLNPAIKGKQAELNARKYTINSAEAGRFPSLSVHANNLEDHYDQGILRLQQPLWAFGKIDTAIHQAEAGFTAEKQEVLKIQRQLIENTAAAYARVEGIRQRAGVARLNIAEHEQLYQRIKRRQAGRLASETDERLAYSRLIQVRAQHLQIKGELQVALIELRSLTQTDVAADIPVDPGLAKLPPMSAIEALALKNSATISFKREQLKVAGLDIKKEKIAPLPTIYFRVEHEFLDTPENRDETRAGFVMEGNFEGLGFTAWGRVRSASARQQASREDLNVAKNDICSRVRTLMLNRKVQRQVSNSQREAVAVVEATMSSFLRQYESGRKTWLDVLNTQRELTELRFQQAQTHNDWLILSLRISALTGRLDQLAGIGSL